MRCNLDRWLRYQYLRIVRQNDTPERIAGGLALGVAIGILPTFGLGIVIVIFIAGWLRLNRVAAVIGTIIMNPWTTPFFWTVSYLAGSVVLGQDLSETLEVISELRSQGDLWENLLAKKLVLPYMTGNLVVTAGVSAFFYVVGFWAVRGYRRARQARRDGKRNKPDTEIGQEDR